MRPPFSKKVLLPNDSLDVSTSIPAILFRGAQGIFYARALDWHGNVLNEAQAPITNEGGPIQCVLHLAELDTPVVKVELYAVPGASITSPPSISNDPTEPFTTSSRGAIPTPCTGPFTGVRLADTAEFASASILDAIKVPFELTERCTRRRAQRPPGHLHGLRYTGPCCASARSSPSPGKHPRPLPFR